MSTITPGATGQAMWKLDQSGLVRVTLTKDLPHDEGDNPYFKMSLDGLEHVVEFLRAQKARRTAA